MVEMGSVITRSWILLGSTCLPLGIQQRVFDMFVGMREDSEQITNSCLLLVTQYDSMCREQEW